MSADTDPLTPAPRANHHPFCSGGLVLFGAGSTIQSAFSILICLASITVYSIYVPLKDPDDNNLQWLAQMQLFLVLLSILLMKADNTEDSSADQTYLGWLLIVMTVPGYGRSAERTLSDLVYPVT